MSARGISAMHPNKGDIRQEHQEACMDEQGAPGQPQTQNGSLEGWKWGQVAWEECTEIV